MIQITYILIDRNGYRMPRLPRNHIQYFCEKNELWAFVVRGLPAPTVKNDNVIQRSSEKNKFLAIFHSDNRCACGELITDTVSVNLQDINEFIHECLDRNDILERWSGRLGHESDGNNVNGDVSAFQWTATITMNLEWFGNVCFVSKESGR